ncbi:LOW QUALITY PROTEIN: hypothetical protein HID58_063709 [Brassica napus]|uniref:Glycosyltransferase n=1 Tax=Brassica napus TaxID=3708 RepID=A0ABQ7XF97_BRANA|nr:LOW QUALITY PROTEIN: hypothetical protein HID58_063709 [Brassica napus]
MAQPQQRPIANRPISFLNRNGLFLLLLALLVFLGVYLPLSESPLFITEPLSSSSPSFVVSDWRDYSLAQAAKFVAKNGTVIVCAVSYPFLPFLNNWLISISRQKHHEKVLVIAEDYALLYKVNEKWPGHGRSHSSFLQHWIQKPHIILVPRPQHLLDILELGYNVMYNDVDMVWLQDPFKYLQEATTYTFMDDMTTIKPLNYSHGLPPSRNGVTYVCSCMIFLRCTSGAKLLLKKWVEEIRAQPWSNTEAKKPHDQPAFNRALHKTTHQVDVYLLPQSAFPSGGLYFKNKKWVNETNGKHVIVHNNYIVGYNQKLKRFQDFVSRLEQNTEEKKQKGRGRKQTENRGQKQNIL